MEPAYTEANILILHFSQFYISKPKTAQMFANDLWIYKREREREISTAIEDKVYNTSPLCSLYFILVSVHLMDMTHSTQSLSDLS